MTNKINGIDVSECPLFDKNTGRYHTFNGECVKDSCAVYKWLLEYKRLQKENEELKEKAPMKLIAKNNKYRSALEEIREIVKEEQADIETVYTKRTYKRLNKIKNKIGEVLK